MIDFAVVRYNGDQTLHNKLERLESIDYIFSQSDWDIATD